MSETPQTPIPAATLVLFREQADGAPELLFVERAKAMVFAGGALVFSAGLAVLAALYFWTQTSRVLLFWAAFILTRPLGATVGDFLDKPVAKGGLEFSRPLATGVLTVAIIALILLLPQRPGGHPESRPART